MDYNFIWSGPSSGAPIVTIARYGITFNCTVIEMMGRPERVMIGVDISNRIVGVQVITADAKPNPQSFSFADRENKAGYIRIGNKDFVYYIANIAGFNLDKTYKFFGSWDNERQLLTVDLNNPINVPD